MVIFVQAKVAFYSRVTSRQHLINHPNAVGPFTNTDSFFYENTSIF